MTITVDPLAYGGGDNPDRRQYLDPRAAVISQYANSPVMLALVDALTLAVDNQGQIDDFYDWVWNIDTAQGIGLDIWGRIVGVKRALYVVADQALGFSDASDALSFADGVFLPMAA